MLHKGTQTLYTSQLILRRFTSDDAQAMFDNWANDPRVTRFLTWPPHQSPAVTKDLLESWCALYEQKDFYLWAITLAGTPIGSISVVKNNPQSACVELGYCIGYLYWNKRLMTC